jgi:rare lipoprotein A
MSFSGFNTERIRQTLAPSHVADAISVEDGDQEHCAGTTLLPALVPRQDRHEPQN